MKVPKFMPDVASSVVSAGRSPSMVQGCQSACPAGETHHVLVIIPLLSWNPSVRVAVPDRKLHGAAEGACNWGRKGRRARVRAAAGMGLRPQRRAPSAHGAAFWAVGQNTRSLCPLGW